MNNKFSNLEKKSFSQQVFKERMFYFLRLYGWWLLTACVS